MSEDEKIEKRLDRKLKLLSFIFNVLVFTGIGICAYLNQKYIECIVLLVAFLTLRYCFPTTYHSRSFWLCLVWSILIFVVTLPNVMPIQYSLLSGVILGCFVDFMLYKIQEYIDLKNFYIEHSKFKLETATKEEIIELCKILHYKKPKIDLAIKFFVDKWTNKQVLEWLCENKLNVEYDTVKQYRYKINLDFKKLLKK